MEMDFNRQLELQLPAVVLVFLIGAVVAFAVFTKPLQELLVGAGGMILALWGIRSLLVPSGISYITLVDVGLGLVMSFLLAAINGRGLVHLVRRNKLRVPGISRAPAAAATKSRAAAARHRILAGRSARALSSRLARAARSNEQA
jgi:hypothetical protein